MHLVGPAAAAAFVVTAIGTAFVIPYLRRRGVMDHPNHRTSHAVVTPRGAGIAFPAALVVAVVAVAIAGIEQLPVLVTIGLVAVVASALGATDDFVVVTARTRLVAQVVIGAAGSAALAIELRDSTTGAVVAALAGGLWCAASINAVNFMDGINGISGGFAVATGVYICIIGGQRDIEPLLAAGAILAGCGGGFLPFNVPSARAFMGDSGSYFIGGLAAACALTIVLDTGNPVLAATPFALYLVDTGVTMIRRWRRGEDLFAPHRAHAYQRLVAAGWSHPASAGLATVTVLIGNALAASIVAGKEGSGPGLVPSVAVALVSVGLAAAYVALADRVERGAGD